MGRNETGGGYSVIYADPAWQYERNKGYGAAENHYKTMSLQELCALPVKNIAAKDSVLFLWATCPLLPEALAVLSAWGYTFKTVAFCWLKPNRFAPGWFKGCGFWTRGNAEICLLGVRGKPRRLCNTVSQVIVEPRREHSRKPDTARDRIVELMGDVRRIELFAREHAPGWDVWGNEVTGVDIFRREA